MRLIITRHGETEENLAGIIQGHLPGRLSENGWKQAERVAERLKAEKIDFIYSSDLARAANTAAVIHKYHKETPIEFVGDLREKFLGEWQGRSKAELGFDKSKSVAAIFPKDGETLYELFERAKDFLTRIIARHCNDTVLFVAHNGINSAMISVITGKSADDIGSLEKQHNTAVNIFDIDQESNHRLHVYNCVKHLD